MSKLTGLAAIVKGGGAMEPQQSESEDATAAVSVVPKLQPAKERLTARKGKPIGPKSSNPDFMQLKVYVRKTTKRAAARKWEDQGGGDVSDLVEQLLNKFLST